MILRKDFPRPNKAKLMVFDSKSENWIVLILPHSEARQICPLVCETIIEKSTSYLLRTLHAT